MIKDLSPKLVAAVAAINQKSREAFVAEQQALQQKQTAKQLGKMPGVAAPKADEPAHTGAKKMAEEAGGTTPKTAEHKKLAALRPPFNKITHGDVLHGRGVKKEEVEQADEAMSHQAKTTMKHIPNPSPALKKAAKDIKPGVSGYRDRIAMLKAGGVKEETQIDELSKSTLGSYLTKKTSEYMKGKTQPGSKEHAKDVQNMGKAYDKLKKEEAELDEAYQTAKSEFVARQGRLTAAAAETEKDPARLKRMSSIPGYSAAMDLAKKTTQGAKHTKEEVESKTIAELSTGTLLKVKHAAVRDANDATRDSDDARADKRYNLAGKASNKIELRNRAAGLKPSGQHALESVEQEEYTFADYLDAVRSQYGDEDAVLIANEAFKNKDITLFSDQSQSPEA